MIVTLHVNWKWDICDKSPQVSLDKYDFSSIGCTGYISGGTIELDLPVKPPSIAQFTAEKIKSLRKEQGKKQHEIDEIEDRIQSLLCIEHKEIAQ